MTNTTMQNQANNTRIIATFVIKLPNRTIKKSSHYRDESELQAKLESLTARYVDAESITLVRS